MHMASCDKMGGYFFYNLVRQMNAPTYIWICHKCGKSNQPHIDTCAFCDFPSIASAVDITPDIAKQSILLMRPLISLSYVLFIADIFVWTKRQDLLTSIVIAAIFSFLGLALAKIDIASQRLKGTKKMYVLSAIAIGAHIIVLNFVLFFLVIMISVK